MAYTILLIEDNPHIMEINYEALIMEEYHVLRAFDCKQGLDALKNYKVDLIILDVMLPDGDGFDLCKKIKEDYDVPILFLSALGENHQIIDALRAGGDDYVTKPYDLGVLLARVEARLRSSHGVDRFVLRDGLKLDTVSMMAYYQGKDLYLTKKEFSILLLLVKNPRGTMSKEELYRIVWGAPLGNKTNALYTAVSRLNNKLDQANAGFIVVSSVSEGYVLTEV